MNSNQYTFQSSWNIDTSIDEVWVTLTAQPFSWSEWWPQLSNVQNMHVTPRLVGTSFSCSWQAPMGYKLHTDITIGDLIHLERVVLHATGDLDGVVTCKLREKNGKTRIDIDWKVETTKPWMNNLTVLLRPVFVWSHHAVMRSGERGLQSYIK